MNATQVAVVYADFIDESCKRTLRDLRALLSVTAHPGVADELRALIETIELVSPRAKSLGEAAQGRGQTHAAVDRLKSLIGGQS